jgi:hypothetical protein
MKKREKYFKVYGIPVVPNPLREVYLKTFETKNEADLYIMSISQIQSDGSAVYKQFKIKVGAYRNLR